MSYIPLLHSATTARWMDAAPTRMRTLQKYFWTFALLRRTS
uniref:Uncharacterized protein n=1 Tax=Arundo donax TaxID=35708 RepID=A0A0A9EI30_ARUDO